ncbi:MAG TPA: alpha/beta hydrolase [Thermoanaerobaculia bacterium]|nr:alpha/beta hydrolase [Thermoanaerobaculia bacterium]
MAPRRKLLDLLALPLAVGGGVVLAAALGRREYRRTQIFKPSPEPEHGWDPTAYGIPAGACEEHWIETPDGEELYAWYCRAEKPVASAIFCHGNRGNLTVSAPIIPHLLEAGLNVLFFDYRGYGKSTGTPSVDGVLDDGVTAARFHDSIRPTLLPSILYGFSLGGAVAAQVVRRHRFDAMILQSTFSNLTAMARLLHPKLPLHLLAGDLFDTIDSVRRLQIPLLVLHGRDDESIPSSMAHELYGACNTPKRIHIVEGGMHGNLFEHDPDSLVRAISQFVAELPEATREVEVEPPSRVEETIDAALRVIRRNLRRKPGVIASAPR